MSNCTFVKAWVGSCRKPLPCNEHSHLECCSCGESATHECGETGQLVCRYPLCNNCEHRIFEDGTNGGIGFNQQPSTKKPHCKKSEQDYEPWYKRSE